MFPERSVTVAEVDGLLSWVAAVRGVLEDEVRAYLMAGCKQDASAIGDAVCAVDLTQLCHVEIG